jgi:hypothetical protein
MVAVAKVERTDLTLDSQGRLPAMRPRPKLGRYGIYVILHESEIIRVGESSSGFDRIAKGFRERLRHNRRGKERKNYIAYAWRVEYKSQSLVLDYFSVPEDPFSEDHLRRALEAEITFQFRIANRRWPRNMSEIHFLERYRSHKELVSCATDVLAFYGHAYNSAA